MINSRITTKELEMFAAEPENNLAFSPNHAMAQEMARELLAWRKAASEPLAYYWFNESDCVRDVSLTSPEEDDDAADALENGWQVEPLIRIPKLTGGDEC